MALLTLACILICFWPLPEGHGAGAVVPIFGTTKNPAGVPKEVVDEIRAGTAYHRSQFYKDIAIPFYGFNRPGAVVSGDSRQLVALGNDGCRHSPLSVRQGPFRDRVLRGSQNDRHSSSRNARRGRSDLPFSNDWSQIGQAPQARHPSNRIRASPTACRPRMQTKSMPTCSHS